MSGPLTQATRPLVLHLLYSFDTGGLENGVVNLLNRLPRDRFRHAVVALTGSGAFRARLWHDDVEYLCLQKGAGHAIKLYPQLYRLFRAWRPSIVHTRNLAALEAMVPARLAGVPVRIHGEHGRDHDDVAGTSRKKQLIRRLYDPFVTHYVALSRELSGYLNQRVGVRERRITRICNGVDTDRFRRVQNRREPIEGSPFQDLDHFVIGAVGRMHAVKDQTTLVQAFIELLQRNPGLAQRARLILVGDGPLREPLSALLAAAGVQQLAWMPGERGDIDRLMRGFDCFVLPSRGEGISNVILEAMATGLPVLATDVGGNAELVQRGVSGELVAAGDAAAMAQVLRCWMLDAELTGRLGRAGRQLAEDRFSMKSMVDAYCKLYQRELESRLPELAAR